LKKIAVFLLLLTAVGAGVFYWRQQQQLVLAEQSAAPPTATVEKGPVTLLVTATGRVVANQDVEIKCKASGQVVQLPFDISDAVKTGQLVAELDPVDEQRQVNLSQVQLNLSKARLESAKQNLLIAQQKIVTERDRAESASASAQARVQRMKTRLERLKGAQAANASTQEDVDSAALDLVVNESELKNSVAQLEEVKQLELALEVRRQDVVLAEEQVRSDQISLENASQRLTDTKVLAPIDGVVTMRPVSIGQIIASGVSNVGGGTSIMTISDLSRIFALGSVDESDIGRVSLNQDVEVTADAYPNRRFKGKVVRIATRGTNVSNVVTFEVKIEVLDPKKNLLKPEMTTNLEIIAARKDDALSVPVEAVVRKKGQRFATVLLADGATEERPVTTGINDGMKIEITEGLAEGDKVVLQKVQSESRWRGGEASKQGGGLNPGRMLGGGKR
jgi:multidrug efflux pump subunit AcrA (membrane-fusion protein)